MRIVKPHGGCYARRMGAVEFFQENWAVIAQAPWAFVAFAVFFGTGGFLIGRYWMNERERNLLSRVAARDEQIKALEGQVAGVVDKAAERQALLEVLTQQYIRSNPEGLSARAKVGLELPPAEWINAELAKLGEHWRVRDVRGNECEIVNLGVWG